MNDTSRFLLCDKEIQDACRHNFELDYEGFDPKIGYNVRNFICTECDYEEQQHG